MDINNFAPMISKKKIEKRITKLAKELTLRYKNEPVVFVCVLKGAVVFYSKLLEKVKNENVELDFIQVKSYCGTETTGKVELIKNISADIKDKHLVLVEDIVDTGITAQFLYEYFKKYNPKSILMCSLLFKPEKLQIKLDMPLLVGFNIPNKFIIGYGLDLDEKYRNLQDIFVLKD